MNRRVKKRPPQDLTLPENYLNRDLSMLEFNHRVLELASDPDIPLLERLKFLCISSSNMDEFFEVRVAILKQRLSVGSVRKGADGLSVSEILLKIRQRAEQIIAGQYHQFNQVLLPAFEEEGIYI